MPINAMFQNFFDDFFAPPKWVQDLDDLPTLPPIEPGSEYDPFAKGDE